VPSRRWVWLETKQPSRHTKNKKVVATKARSSFLDAAKTAAKLMAAYESSKRAYEEDEEPEQLAWTLLAHRNNLDLGPQLQLDTCDKNNLMRFKWVNPQPLIKDDVGGLVKAYIQEN
jgi:hypothetical protein